MHSSEKLKTLPEEGVQTSSQGKDIRRRKIPEKALEEKPSGKREALRLKRSSPAEEKLSG